LNLTIISSEEKSWKEEARVGPGKRRKEKAKTKKINFLSIEFYYSSLIQ